MIDLRALISSASELEPLPASATRLASLISRENWKMGDLLDVIAFDQALTPRILRMANSAASGSRSTIVNVRDAVVRLGPGSVLSLAIGSRVRDKMQKPVPQYGLREGQLWTHSVAAALAAEMAGAYCGVPIPKEAFAASLLHDVGKLLLARFLSPEVLDVLDRAQHLGGLDRLRAESEVLEVHHAELGGLIAQNWALPAGIARGITHHHTPDEGNDAVSDVVHLANVVAKNIEENPSAPADRVLLPGPKERLRITDENLASLCAAARERLGDVLAQYN